MIAIYLNAGNDRNGNPRRCFVILDDQANVVDVVDEGYSGTGALKANYEGIPISPRIETTPAEYRSFLEQASRLNVQRHPFRKEITDNYKVDSAGRIRNPGKFEGEMVYVPHFWDVFMNGSVDEELEDGTLVFEVGHDERVAFPELKTKKKVKLRQRDDGFVIEV